MFRNLCKLISFPGIYFHEIGDGLALFHHYQAVLRRVMWNVLPEKQHS